MSDNGGGFFKPWKDGFIENLFKVTGAAWWIVFLIGLFGLANPLTPDQYFSSLYWGRILNSLAVDRSK